MNDASSYAPRKLIQFYLITFGISWILWLPFVLPSTGLYEMSDTLTSLMTLAVALGAFAPLISAVILVYKSDGKVGIKKFFKRVLNFKMKPVYYLLAVLIPLLTTMFAHYFTNLTGIDTLPNNLFPEDLGIPVILLVIPYIIFIMIAGGGQEEFGWRGYAQEPMQNRFGILKGSLLLGLIWAIWHLPLWFMIGEGHTYYSFFAFLLYTVSLGLIIGILYNISGKKMVVTLITHTIANVAVPFFPVLFMEDVPQPGYWVWAITTAVFAIAFAFWYQLKIPKEDELNK